MNVENKSYELGDFVQSQKTWVDSIRRDTLDSFQGQVRLIVENAGKLCLKEKGFEVDADMRSIEEQRKMEQASVKGERYEMKGNVKILSFTEQAARRSECRKLQRFVKLADYMMVVTLQNLTLDSVRDLCESVFKGCRDSDVVVTSGENTSSADTDNINEIMSASLETSSLGAFQLSQVQVGGAVVGPEVKTSELINTGADGFPGIISRIVKGKMTNMGITEVVKDELIKELGKDFLAMIERDEIDALEKKKIAEKILSTGESGAAQKAKKDAAAAAVEDLKKRFLPLFKTELLLTINHPQNQLFFSPGLPDYLAGVETLIKLFVTTVEDFQLLTNTITYLDPSNMSGAYSSIRGLEEPEFTEGPTMRAIISESGYFREVCGRIRGALVGMFSNAGHWMAKWDHVRKMYVDNGDFSGPRALENVISQVTHNVVGQEGSYTAAVQMGVGLWTSAEGSMQSPFVDFYNTSLSKFTEQRHIMVEIPLQNTINNILVETERLKNVLIPSPERCFSEVSKSLPGLASDKNESLLSEVQTWVRVLNTNATSVESFVEYLGWLEKVRDSMLTVGNQYDEISRLYTLMETYKIPIQPTDLALFQTLGPTIRQLRDAVEMASETKEESITRFSVELEKQVTELMAEVLSIRNKAQDPMVLNPSAQPEVVIKFLDCLGESLKRVEGLKSKYEMWGELFKTGGNPSAPINSDVFEKEKAPVQISKAGELEETRIEVDLKRTLWVSISEWETLTE